VAAVRRPPAAGHPVHGHPRPVRPRRRTRRGGSHPVDAHRPQRRRPRGVTPELAAGVGTPFAQKALDGPLLMAVLVAAPAGALSLSCPRVAAVVRGAVGYVAGLCGGSLDDGRTTRVVVGVARFVMGFAVVFVAVGAGFVTLGMLLNDRMGIVNRVLGLLVIV